MEQKALESEINFILTSSLQGNFMWYLAESSTNQAQVGLVGLPSSTPNDASC